VPDAHLLMIGDGPELPRLKQMAEDLGLTDHVHFTGLASGDRMDGLLAESAITTLRFGQDVGQGAGLIGTMVGVAIQRQAADVLAGLIASDALPPAERARLRDELHYVNRHTFSVTEAIESEFLVLGALWVHGEVSVPPTALLPTGEEALTERVMMARLADDHLRLADELLPRLDAPFPERLEAYDAYVEGMDDPWMAPDYARYDIQLTASRSRLLLLEIAAADGAFRAAQGRPPADLDELAKATPTLPRTDPLTADAFVLETVGGVRTLRSAAPGADGDPARLAQTGTSWNYDRMLQLELPAEATPIP